MRAPVAQRIEQRVSNPLAVGSIPTGGTNSNRIYIALIWGKGVESAIDLPHTLFMSILSSFLYPLMPWTMLFLRFALAAIFYVHSTPKLKNPGAMAGGMGMSSNMVWIVGLVETVAAASVLLGLLTQLGALAMVALMLGAIYYKTQKWSVPFSKMGTMGWEFDLIILAAALLLASTGPGYLSVDWKLLGIY